MATPPVQLRGDDRLQPHDLIGNASEHVAIAAVPALSVAVPLGGGRACLR
jgi:hypothetical protein